MSAGDSGECFCISLSLSLSHTHIAICVCSYACMCAGSRPVLHNMLSVAGIFCCNSCKQPNSCKVPSSPPWTNSCRSCPLRCAQTLHSVHVCLCVCVHEHVCQRTMEGEREGNFSSWLSIWCKWYTCFSYALVHHWVCCIVSHRDFRNRPTVLTQWLPGTQQLLLMSQEKKESVMSLIHEK